MTKARSGRAAPHQQVPVPACTISRPQESEHVRHTQISQSKQHSRSHPAASRSWQAGQLRRQRRIRIALPAAWMRFRQAMSPGPTVRYVSVGTEFWGRRIHGRKTAPMVGERESDGGAVVPPRWPAVQPCGPETEIGSPQGAPAHRAHWGARIISGSGARVPRARPRSGAFLARWSWCSDVVRGGSRQRQRRDFPAVASTARGGVAR